jgi:hypothetical protein
LDSGGQCRNFDHVLRLKARFRNDALLTLACTRFAIQAPGYKTLASRVGEQPVVISTGLMESRFHDVKPGVIRSRGVKDSSANLRTATSSDSMDRHWLRKGKPVVLLTQV